MLSSEFLFCGRNSSAPANGSRQRICIGALEPRGDGSTQEEIRRVLESLGAGEGEPCRANCDCAIGLICRDGACETDW